MHGSCVSIVRAQGMCAEKCVSDFGFTRKELDDFAILSYTRAAAAWKVWDCTACVTWRWHCLLLSSCAPPLLPLQAGKFNNEIVPVEVKAGKAVTIVSEDEEFKKAKLDKIPTLKPAFKPDGARNQTELESHRSRTNWVQIAFHAILSHFACVGICVGTITAANASSLNDGASALVHILPFAILLQCCFRAYDAYVWCFQLIRSSRLLRARRHSA